jgi:hypothetical protein
VTLAGEGDDGAGYLWHARRRDDDGEGRHGDLHHLSPADERAHEGALRALAAGGFDAALAGLGHALGLDGLAVVGVTFAGASHGEEDRAGGAAVDTRGGAFRVVIPLAFEEDAPPEVVLWDDGEGEGEEDGGDAPPPRGEIKYRRGTGIVLGDGAAHGATAFDLRARTGLRLAAIVDVAEVWRGNVHGVARAMAAARGAFPPRDAAEAWLLAQEARHWRREGGGQGLAGDVGRRPFVVEDYVAGCTEEDCVTGDRNSCLRTCRVFMHDSEYKPGKERHEVLGY